MKELLDHYSEEELKRIQIGMFLELSQMPFVDAEFFELEATIRRITDILKERKRC